MGFVFTAEDDFCGIDLDDWIEALMHGLAGVDDASGQLQSARLNLRWAVTDRDEVRVTMRYAASEAYIAYRMRIDRNQRRMDVEVTSSDSGADVRVLMADGWTPSNVRIDGQDVEIATEAIDASVYVKASVSASPVATLTIQCE